jgi:hypothetical protein
MDIIMAAAELFKTNKGKGLIDGKVSRDELEMTLRFPRPEKSDLEMENFQQLSLILLGDKV